MKTVERWRTEGYDYAGIRGDGSVYPCRREDIPAGAVDTYLALDSEEADIAVNAAESQGWTLP